MFENLFGYVRVYHDSFTYRIIAESLSLGWAVLPGLVVGLIVSSALVAWWPVGLLKQQPLRWTVGSILLMAAAGVISPFCSYLAVPIASALILNGVAPAPVAAFLCATPLMNPTLFGMTLSELGWPMALARTFSALGMGVVGGLIVLYFTPRISGLIRQPSE
ncbi:permease, partial [bacterium]|nr:permease [bacterium]